MEDGRHPPAAMSGTHLHIVLESGGGTHLDMRAPRKAGRPEKGNSGKAPRGNGKFGAVAMTCGQRRVGGRGSGTHTEANEPDHPYICDVRRYEAKKYSDVDLVYIPACCEEWQCNMHVCCECWNPCKCNIGVCLEASHANTVFQERANHHERTKDTVDVRSR